MKIAITGVAGRMGRTLARIVHETDGCEVAGGLEQSGSDALGLDIGTLAGVGELGVAVTDDPLELFTRIDGILDFTVSRRIGRVRGAQPPRRASSMWSGRPDLLRKSRTKPSGPRGVMRGS